MQNYITDSHSLLATKLTKITTFAEQHNTKQSHKGNIYVKTHSGRVCDVIRIKFIEFPVLIQNRLLRIQMTYQPNYLATGFQTTHKIQYPYNILPSSLLHEIILWWDHISFSKLFRHINCIYVEKINLSFT